MTRVTRVTREHLSSWDLGYTDEQISELVPPDGITPLSAANHPDMTYRDRVRVLLREDVLGRPVFLECLARLVERSLARVADPDPRSAAVVDAIRTGTVTSEIVEAARASAWAARAAAASASAGEGKSGLEYAAQLNDIREMLAK